MDEFELMAEEESIKSLLGRKASFWRYDRTPNTPMNLLLETVEQQVSSQFSVYWVSDWTPEVFCLRGESRTLVIFSERYLELVGDIRHSIVQDSLADVRVELAERTCLKLIAKFALRYGDPEFAVLCFLKSIVGKSFYIFDTNLLLNLERQPIDEAYMATWFYGLAHELGHVASRQLEMSMRGGLFSDEAILAGIEIALDHFPYPEAFKQESLVNASKYRSEFILGIDNLRSEGFADIFAATILLQSTYNIMGIVKSGLFKIENFIAEMIVFLNIIIIIHQCRQVAQLASQSTPDRSAREVLALHPVAAHVRALMLHEDLGRSAATFIFNTKDISEQQLKQSNELVNEISRHLGKAIKAIDTGMGRAMRFSLFAEERDQHLLEKFTDEVSGGDAFSSILEAQQFCELADLLEVHGEGLDALKTIVAI
jgi:hypothetical protein